MFHYAVMISLYFPDTHQLCIVCSVGIFDDHEFKQPSHRMMAVESQVNEFIRQLILLWFQKKPEQRRVAGKRLQILTEKSFFSDQYPDDCNLCFTVPTQRIAAIGLADITLVFANGNLVVRSGAERFVALMIGKVYSSVCVVEVLTRLV